MAQPIVKIEGLKELRRDLIGLDRDYFPRAMVAAGKAIAEPMAGRIAGALPKRSNRLAGSVRAGAVRTGAIVRTGTAGVPYAGPVEFGGWPRGRPFISTGRYIFPTARGSVVGAAAAYTREIGLAITRYAWSHPA